MSAIEIAGAVARIILVIILVVLSVYDVKNRGVPVILIIISAVVAVAYLIFQIVYAINCRETADVTQAMAGMVSERSSIKKILITSAAGLIPGIFQLVISFATRKAGIADGILLCIIGAVENYLCGMVTWAVGSLMIALISSVLLGFKKVNRNTKMPYIPFLTAGYLFGKIVLKM